MTTALRCKTGATFLAPFFNTGILFQANQACQACWHTLVFLVYGLLKQEVCELEAVLAYTGSSCQRRMKEAEREKGRKRWREKETEKD